MWTQPPDSSDLHKTSLKINFSDLSLVFSVLKICIHPTNHNEIITLATSDFLCRREEDSIFIFCRLVFSVWQELLVLSWYCGDQSFWRGSFRCNQSSHFRWLTINRLNNRTSLQRFFYGLNPDHDFIFLKVDF